MAKNLNVKLTKNFQEIGLNRTDTRLYQSIGGKVVPALIAGDTLQIDYALESSRERLRAGIKGISAILHLADRGYSVSVNKTQAKQTAALLKELGSLIEELAEVPQTTQAPSPAVDISLSGLAGYALAAALKNQIRRGLKNARYAEAYGGSPRDISGHPHCDTGSVEVK